MADTQSIGAPRIMCLRHPDRPAKARGMCNACYVKLRYDNDQQYRAARLATAKAWRAEHPDRAAALQRKSRAKTCPVKKYDRMLRKKYGINIEDYTAILAEQNGRCAICRMEPSSGKKLHVDHCHESGVVRGGPRPGEYPNKDGTYTIAVVIDEQKRIWRMESDYLTYTQVLEKVHACGAGQDFAIGALEAGATAAEAIRITMKRSDLAGLGVDTVRFA